VVQLQVFGLPRIILTSYDTVYHVEVLVKMFCFGRYAFRMADQNASSFRKNGTMPTAKRRTVDK
jgi:hypothetical protein